MFILLLMQLFLQQLQQSVRPHYLDGKTINGRMRAILVDWLVQVHSRFQLLQETLYMCVAIMDRFLQVSLRCLSECLDYTVCSVTGDYSDLLVSPISTCLRQQGDEQLVLLSPMEILWMEACKLGKRAC